MSNKFYDRLKLVALFIMPLLTCIAGILGVWQVPYADKFAESLPYLNTFIGAAVIIANKNYNANIELFEQENEQ